MRKVHRFAFLAALLLLSSSAFDIPAVAPDGSDGGTSAALSPRADMPAVVINEFLPAPRTIFTSEWIELFNPGDLSVQLGGWALDDIPNGGSKPFIIPDGTAIAPGSFLVFYNSTTRISLNNDGDTVRLLDPTGGVADEYGYGPAGYDASVGRSPDGGPGWQSFTAPTPGAPNGAPPAFGPAGNALLITQVFYFAYPGKNDEFVAVSNPPGNEDVDLYGWSLTDDRSSVSFPPDTTLPSGATLYITGNGSDFLGDCGFLPGLETSGSSAGVRQAPASGGWPALGNTGGAVALRNPGDETVDAFAWGRAFNGSGWTGPPAQGLLDGEVARRARGPGGGWADTNTSGDWPLAGRTVVGRSDFPLAGFDAGKVRTFVSPDSSYSAISSELDGARSSIRLSMYQLESWPLAGRLVAARQRGVDVRVLLEGAPVGGVLDQERAIVRLLAETGASVACLAPNASARSDDRYSFLHAKYCLIDGRVSIVTSENWKPSGVPKDTSYGNRGWGAVVESAGLAGYLSAVFDADSATGQRDVIPYPDMSGVFGPPPEGFVPNTTVPAGGYKPQFARSEFAGARVSVVLSPDTSSLANSSVLGLIGSAAKTLYVEQLSCTLSWDSDRGKRPNEYLEAVVDAARRGVRVRLLLDGTYIDDTDSGEGNAGVVNYLAYTAAREGLDLQARTAAIPGTLKLHNKGIIVDGGHVLVSSINWGRNSVFENREVGLIIDGAGPASYYERVFLYDWNFSAGEPPAGGDNGTKGGAPAGDALAGALRGLSVVLPLAAVAAAVLFFVRRSARRRDYHSPRSRTRR